MYELPRLFCELRSVEQVIREVAEEFDGEDPAIPPARHLLDSTTEKLSELSELMPEVLPSPTKTVPEEIEASWS